MNIVPNLTFSIDPNVIMAIITVVAVISPIATALIDNIFQYHRENLQHYELAKRQALIDFIESVNNFRQTHNASDTARFHSSVSNLYIYFSNVCVDIPYLEDTDDYQFNLALEKIIVNLSKQISKK